MTAAKKSAPRLPTSEEVSAGYRPPPAPMVADPDQTPAPEPVTETKKAGA